jgi:hypothetical protein
MPVELARLLVFFFAVDLFYHDSFPIIASHAPTAARSDVGKVICIPLLPAYSPAVAFPSVYNSSPPHLIPKIMSINLSILIFRGSPLDTSLTRTVGLLFTRPPFISYMTLNGISPFFTFEETLSTDPRKDPSLAGTVEVAQLPKDLPYDPVKAVVMGTRIRSADREFNGKLWCAEVLAKFVELGWVSGEERVRAVDGMVGWLLKGEDEA